MFDGDAARAPQILDALASSYDSGSPTDARLVRELSNKSGRRTEGMTNLAALYEREGDRAVLYLLATGADDASERELRQAILQLRTAERERSQRLGTQWNAMHERGVQMVFAMAALVATLVVGLALTLAVRAHLAARHKATLEGLVRERTHELDQLSTELQSLTERERAHIARELHDELGGILVAVKMDLTPLKQRLEGRDPDLVARIARMESALMSGITLKRRILEQLHPSLLDNVGLMAAVR